MNRNSINSFMKKGLLVSGLLVVSVSQSLAGLLETGFEATYDVLYNEFYLGTAVRTLQPQDNQTWIYRSHTSPKGIASAFVSDIIDETSTIRKYDNRFQPSLYDYHQHGGKKDKAFQLKFDWKSKQLSNTYTKKEYPLSANTHDLLSFQIQLMQDMQAGKTSISYIIADKKRVDTYSLKLTETENVETPMKTFSAIKMVSNKIRDKMQFIIWCAPELGYLPIKVMKIDDDGDESVLILESLKLTP